ncbi:hypothetical protein Ddye_024546 [Dipteronia dyeriana]|uniref:X8 domain-containing protein n=1 Tax=Dipteronia dyeriana TaxID=168575 RepID=A0AAD9WUA3_9ROSI|nr:hypothetical protein Ddye_024546 [Dipteronia dyeriana]
MVARDPKICSEIMDVTPSAPRKANGEKEDHYGKDERPRRPKWEMIELSDVGGKIGIRRTLSQMKPAEVFSGGIDLACQMTATNHPVEHVGGDKYRFVPIEGLLGPHKIHPNRSLAATMASSAPLYNILSFVIFMLSFYSGYGIRSYDGGVVERVPSITIDIPLHVAMRKWCIPKNGTSDELLQSNIDYACANGANCGPIQVHQVCYLPNKYFYHASFAMNSYFYTVGGLPANCDFNSSGRVVFFDPSYDACIYPSS